jgi:DNA integrity scanning protein DisA with diadenylate cyclase activity
MNVIQELLPLLLPKVNALRLPLVMLLLDLVLLLISFLVEMDAMNVLHQLLLLLLLLALKLRLDGLLVPQLLLPQLSVPMEKEPLLMVIF